MLAERPGNGLGGWSESASFQEPAVGWSQSDGGFGSGDILSVAETAVTFDLSALDQAPRKVVGTAVLVYDEAASKWRDGKGNDQMKAGCVAVLGTATTDWAHMAVPAAQFPTEFYDAAPNGSTREWDVKSHVNEQLRFPEDASLRYGFVLQGGTKLHDLRGDDEASCHSRLSNIRLVITYVALSN